MVLLLLPSGEWHVGLAPANAASRAMLLAPLILALAASAFCTTAWFLSVLQDSRAEMLPPLLPWSPKWHNALCSPVPKQAPQVVASCFEQTTAFFIFSPIVGGGEQKKKPPSQVCEFSQRDPEVIGRGVIT